MELEKGVPACLERVTKVTVFGVFMDQFPGGLRIPGLAGQVHHHVDEFIDRRGIESRRVETQLEQRARLFGRKHAT